MEQSFGACKQTGKLLTALSAAASASAASTASISATIGAGRVDRAVSVAPRAISRWFLAGGGWTKYATTSDLFLRASLPKVSWTSADRSLRHRATIQSALARPVALGQYPEAGRAVFCLRLSSFVFVCAHRARFRRMIVPSLAEVKYHR